jgi:hypothetical protein
VSDPRSYDRARIDRWKLSDATAPDNGKCGHPSPKPPGGAPRGERTGLESVRYTPRKRGQTRLASAIVECAFLGAPPTPSLGRAEGKDEKRGTCEPRNGRVVCEWQFEIMRQVKDERSGRSARPRAGHPRKSPMRDHPRCAAVSGNFRGDPDSGDPGRMKQSVALDSRLRGNERRRVRSLYRCLTS